MELPQPRSFGAEGGRKTTHDFLSLYSPVQQDPRPPPQGGYFKTHDFLQPLERVEKNIGKEEVAIIENPPPPPPLAAPLSVTHILPGGIGTYSICYNDQQAQKPDEPLFSMASKSADRNDENSNCSSYSGSGFTLWDESVAKKGKTGKENISGDRHSIRGVSLGGERWSPPSERPSQSSGQKRRGFVNMMTSSMNAQEDEDDDDEEEFVVKKEPSLHPTGNLSVKVNGKSTEQKPNTPRSKHSATEQRRRSKINDRFQTLREIIPNSDQKRDKASFLLEVIEYIQYLQEKTNRYEGSSYPGWTQEPPKLMPWTNSYRPGEGFMEPCTNSGSGQGLLFPTKFDDKKKLVDSEISTIAKPKCPDLSDVYRFGGSSSIPGADMNKTPSHLWPSDCAVGSDQKQKDHAPQSIESGTISISSVYSQELLNTLTQALQKSGVDLSQAKISVQIDLAKREKSTRPYSSGSASKDDEFSMNDRADREREESEQALKRFKTSRN